MFTSEDCEVASHDPPNRIRHYKIASEMRRCQRQATNCYRIPEN